MRSVATTDLNHSAGNVVTVLVDSGIINNFPSCAPVVSESRDRIDVLCKVTLSAILTGITGCKTGRINSRVYKIVALCRTGIGICMTCVICTCVGGISSLGTCCILVSTYLVVVSVCRNYFL